MGTKNKEFRISDTKFTSTFLVGGGFCALEFFDRSSTPQTSYWKRAHGMRAGTLGCIRVAVEELAGWISGTHGKQSERHDPIPRGSCWNEAVMCDSARPVNALIP